MNDSVILLLIIVALGVLVLSFTVGGDLGEKIRKKRHPIWYEHYNRALHNAFEIGGKYTKMLDSINERRKLAQDTFIEGKCTAEVYKDTMKAIDSDFIDAYKWYKQAEEALRINEDLKAADAYAKEHNLKWGIIYE